MRVVLATGNPGKLQELRALLEPLGHDVEPQSEHGVVPIEETGSTFAENALLKARHAARHTGLAALADDSGLEVDALGGRPGVYSARFAGPAASDQENNRKLLEALKGFPAHQRDARYRCVLALVQSADDPHPVLCEGRWEGRIGFAPAGTNGFGYDPLFLVAGRPETAAQLDADIKNRISHRGQALARLVATIGRTGGGS
jgi:XTP/dITP diphosphohydrolase